MEPVKIILRLVAVAVFLALILFAVRFCTNVLSNHDQSLIGDGNMIRRDIPVEKPFRSLEVNGSVNVWLRQGNPATIQILADSNLQPFLVFEFADDLLTIRQKRSLHWSGTAKVLITVPDINRIGVEGAAEINIPDTLRTDQFTLDIKGAAMANLSLLCHTFHSEISGAGEIRLKGRAESVETRINGAGKMAAKEFLIMNHDIRINGAGSVTTSVSDTLRATLNGTGEVKYSGNPFIIPDINGIGRIHRME
jgi:hypothetical protein